MKTDNVNSCSCYFVCIYLASFLDVACHFLFLAFSSCPCWPSWQRMESCFKAYTRWAVYLCDAEYFDTHQCPSLYFLWQLFNCTCNWSLKCKCNGFYLYYLGGVQWIKELAWRPEKEMAKNIIHNFSTPTRPLSDSTQCQIISDRYCALLVIINWVILWQQ